MQMVFENSYTCDMETLKEAFNVLIFRGPLVIVSVVMLIACFVINVLWLFMYKISSIFILWYVPLLFGWMFFLLRYRCSDILKKNREICGSAVVVHTIVTQDYIQISNSTGATLQITYANIKFAVQSRRLIVLRSQANQSFIFRTDAFTTGNAQEFLWFLHQKGIRIK